jgi:hypothetical protein
VDSERNRHTSALVHRPISPLEYPPRGKTGTGNQLPTAQLDPVPVLRGLHTRKHLSDDALGPDQGILQVRSNPCHLRPWPKS